MPRKSARTKPLTAEEIASTSLAIVDRDGLAGLTMRMLGQELQCDPMAIYRHVEDRERLLSLVAAVAIAEVEIPDPELDSRSWLLEFSDRARETFHRHPNVVVLVGHSQLSASTGLGLIEQLVAHLEGADRPGELADRINAYLGALIGYVTLELSPPASEPRPVSIDPDTQPRLAANAEQLVGRTFGLRSRRTEIVPLAAGFSLLMATVVDRLLGDT